jgi:hypothetical protein
VACGGAEPGDTVPDPDRSPDVITDPMRQCGPQPDGSPPRLTVSGTGLAVRCGQGLKPVRLKGLNRSGLQHKNGLQQAGFASDPTAELRRWRDEWGATMIRLPFGQSYYTTYAEAPQYRQGIAAVIAAARSLGLYVVLDLHGYDAANLNIALPDPVSTPALWADLARSFGGEPHVAFDLWNEPHSVPWATWKTHAERILRAIRDAGAGETLAVIGGLDWAYDLSPLADPANRISDLGPVIYATHPYPWKSSPPTTAVQWEARFGQVAGQVPVLIGEFGADDSNSMPVGLGSKAAARAWLESFLAYADGKGLSTLAWSGGDLPHLTLGTDGGPVSLPANPPDPGRPTDPFGQIVKTWMQAP